MKSLLKKEGFFATDLEGTEADSSEMSECGEWGELAGGHDDVFSRCKKRINYFGTNMGNHASPAYAQDGCRSAEAQSAHLFNKTRSCSIYSWSAR
jgi:hypothetical protein